MALHKDLPIYKPTYDLLVLIAEVARHMPRDYKQSLGGKLRDEVMTLTLQIYRANSARNKVPHLDEMLERLQVVEMMLRVGHDLRTVPTKHYARAIELTNSIGKQANGWRKQSSAASPDV